MGDEEGDDRSKVLRLLLRRETELNEAIERGRNAITMIGVGKAKQYANVLDKPLSRGRQEVLSLSLEISVESGTQGSNLGTID